MNVNLKLKIYKFLNSITFGKSKKYYSSKIEKYEQKLNPPFLDYEFNRRPGNFVRNGYDFYYEENSIVNYAQLNKLKELQLIDKIKRGKKAKVCFMLDHIAKFSSISVYHAMEQSEIFEPFLVLYSTEDKIFDNNEIWFKHKESLKILENNGYKVCNGYNELRQYIPITDFSPDIVFLNTPALCYTKNMYLNNVFMNVNFLVCYLNYAFNTINSYDYHYNNKRIASCWKHFVETREDYLELLDHSKYFGTNCVLTGYPKLDKYIIPIEECKIPTKINNGKPIVIYAPHRSIHETWEPLNLSTFHIYYEKFLELAKNYSDINFVFKPHPFLYNAVIKNNIMNDVEFNDYLKQWDLLPNGIIVDDGEYIDLFRKSDLLITDCGSFIGEWLPTEKPCIYLVNPERNQKTYMDGFSLMGRKILEKYYLAHNQEEIDKYFKMIMFDKQDPMKEERIKLKDELFINIGCAGQKIVDYLTEILTD